MSKTAFIFARGGSKGLPGKNIMPLAGKPLIGWSIEHALSVPSIERVIVSTDDEKIAEIAWAWGATIPFLRPETLASDTVSEIDAWRHALETLRELEGALPHPFISIPATSPLRLPKDITACLDLFGKGGSDMVVAVTEPHRNPWFNMVRIESDRLIVPVNSTERKMTRRQDAPAVYDMTTIAYVADPQFVLRESYLFSGRVRAVQIPVERSIDIDTQFDFDIAEFLMNKRLGML